MRNRSLHMMPASRLTLAAASDDAAQLAERHETLAGEALAEISRTPATARDLDHSEQVVSDR
jgi:hypothetical protein